MIQYFTKENEVVNFNLEGALVKQHKIWTKYESNQNELLLYCCGERQFIDKYDKYLLMTLEEINEAIDEFKNVKDRANELYVLEVIDILMYNLTMLDIVQLNIRTFRSAMGITENNSVLVSDLKIKPEIWNYDLTKNFIDVFNILISTRRLYSARKWHKPHFELDNEKNLNNLIETYNLLVLSVNNLCSLLVANTSCERLNKLISDKQDFVINLPMYHK